MKLSGDPRALLFLGLDQSTADVRKRLLRQFAIGDVDARTDVSGKGIIRVKSRHSSTKNPSILTIMSPEAILHLERFPSLDRTSIGLHAMLQILGVHAPRPPEIGRASCRERVTFCVV